MAEEMKFLPDAEWPAILALARSWHDRCKGCDCRHVV